MTKWPDDETVIRQILVEMNQCFLRGDFEARSRFLTADSLPLPQDEPEPLTREQIGASFEQGISKA